MLVAAEFPLRLALQAAEFLGEFAADGAPLPLVEIVADLAVIGGVLAGLYSDLREQAGDVEIVIAHLAEHQHVAAVETGVDAPTSTESPAIIASVLRSPTTEL